ncbi:MAG: TIGR03118 family protein [Flavitalea sp.]
MKKLFTLKGYLPALYSCLLFFVIILSFGACKKLTQEIVLKHFDQVNLVDNNGEYMPQHVDATLINAWGIAFNPAGVPWVNSQGGGVSEVYDKDGNTLRPGVWIPGPTPKVAGNPTGIVFNASNDFLLSDGKAAKFIFVGVDGVLSAWNPGAGNAAELIKNNSATAVYTGLAIGKILGGNYIFAADFRGGKITTWDKNWNKVSLAFKDPTLPVGYSPFNIQAVGNWLYVAYAKVGADGDEVVGAGNGYVSIFKTDGTFVKRFASKGGLNAPWGIAHAPAAFFKDSDDDMFSKLTDGIKDMVLIGNFGDGQINVYSEAGDWIGVLKSRGKPIVIDRLWAISFPPAASPIDPNRLYFAAGPDDEKDGLFGYIIKE